MEGRSKAAGFTLERADYDGRADGDYLAVRL